MAGRKPKGLIMTPAEMVETNQEKKSSRIYKAEAMHITDEAISQTVAKGLAQMMSADVRSKIDLNDFDMVKSVSLEYTKTCQETATFPSMNGLAIAFGCSRQSLYYWINHKKDTDTGKWLMLCHDLFSDILAEASLRNNCNPIVSIFLQKAMYGLRDNVSVEINQIQEDDSDHHSAQYYKDKYINLIPE